MDSEITQMEAAYKLWNWVQKNQKQLVAAVLIALVVGFGYYYYTVKRETAEATAAEELAKLRPTPTPNGPPVPVKSEAYLKIVNEYPGTQAAGRAMLLAASAFFAEEKFAEAKTQFERFLSENPQSPFRGQALYGSAVCLEAQGNTAGAESAYKNIVDHYASDPVAPRAKLSQARTLEAQKQPEQAYKLYEDLVQTERSGLLAMLAEVRIEDLKRVNPNLGTRSVTNSMTIAPPPNIVRVTPTNTMPVTVPKTNRP